MSEACSPHTNGYFYKRFFVLFCFQSYPCENEKHTIKHTKQTGATITNCKAMWANQKPKERCSPVYNQSF